MTVRHEEYSSWSLKRSTKSYEGDLKRGDQYENPARISTGSWNLTLPWVAVFQSGGGLVSGAAITRARRSLRLTSSVKHSDWECYALTTTWKSSTTRSSRRDKMGVNIDELSLVEGATIEEIGDKMESLFCSRSPSRHRLVLNRRL